MRCFVVFSSLSWLFCSNTIISVESRALTDSNIHNAADLWEMNQSDAIAAYDLHISDWDTSNVTDMSSLFYNKPNFNSDITKWDVTSVTSMNQMFAGTKSFNQPLSSWRVSNVEDFDFMFKTAEAFNADIKNWRVSSAKSMYSMFEETASFNQDLSSWTINFKQTKSISRMFYNATGFNQTICWDIPPQIDITEMFCGSKGGRFSFECTKPYIIQTHICTQHVENKHYGESTATKTKTSLMIPLMMMMLLWGFFF